MTAKLSPLDEFISEIPTPMVISHHDAGRRMGRREGAEWAIEWILKECEGQRMASIEQLRNLVEKIKDKP